MKECSLPILGVCLGHQGLVSGLGGKVVSAKPPMHGRLSEIFHNQKGIFKSIPSPFQAVRYHSLIASPESLPEMVETIAWSSGITDSEPTIMGLKHKTKPIWTVQFHPESICTDFGQLLLNNFCILTEESWNDVISINKKTSRGSDLLLPEFLVGVNVIPQPLVSPNFCRSNKFSALIKQLPIYVNSESVFSELFSNTAECFWLDSAKIENGLSRYSFMGGGSFGPEG